MVNIRGIIDYQLLPEKVKVLICSLSNQFGLAFCEDGILQWKLHFSTTDQELKRFAEVVNKRAKELGYYSNGYRPVRIAIFFGADNYDEIS